MPISEKWDKRYQTSDREPLPAAVLKDNQHLLPAEGTALDLACGLGANALLLSQQGLETLAWDISSTAIEKLAVKAKEKGLVVQAEVRDVEVQPPEANRFDVIVVSHFLDRNLIPALIDALKPEGLIFYQTFIREAVTTNGPSNPAYRLGKNELLQLFNGLVLRVYREEGEVGDTQEGLRDVAYLVAQRSS